MKYFTEKEIEDFKNSSVNYPYMVVEKEQNEVIEVSQIVSIAGMGENNGTPTIIYIQVHKKGEKVKHLRYLLEKRKEQMTTERIKEIQSNTAYPDSISVQQALLQVWNECKNTPVE